MMQEQYYNLTARELHEKEDAFENNIRIQNNNILGMQIEINKEKNKIRDNQKLLNQVKSELKQREEILSGKHIYIIKNNRYDYVRAKVRYRKKDWWYHLGTTKFFSNTSRSELIEMIIKRHRRRFNF